MKFGFKTSLQDMSWAEIATFWRTADEIDLFESGWVNDHLYHPAFPDGSESSNSFEAFTALASLATITSRVRIGTLVAGNLFRHPALLARMAVTIDHISDGRFELGIGAGWHEREHSDHGIDLMAPGPRSDAFAESCFIVTSLLAGDTVTVAGKHYELDEARLRPGPVQKKLPLTIGGSGEKRTLRTVAEFADHWNFGSVQDADNFTHKCAVLRQHCDAVGRDYDEISKSIQLWVPKDSAALVEQVTRAQDQGADTAILYFAKDSLGSAEKVADAMISAGLHT